MLIGRAKGTRVFVLSQQGFLTWPIGSTRRETTRMRSDTACSCGDKSRQTRPCSCSCPPFISSVGGWISKFFFYRKEGSG